MELWGITDSGKVRKHNQDVYKIFSDTDKGIAVMVVCDGMGGANAGHIASQMAADEFMSHMCRKIEAMTEISSMQDIVEMITDAVISANTAVYNKSLQSESLSGMGTTLTAAVSTVGGEVVANVGDSRLYHVTESRISQITRDHSVVEEMIERGEITRNESRKHPSRNLITRALGTSAYEPPDIFNLNLNCGEYLILCSDGLTNVVLDSEIQFELINGGNVRMSCEVLVNMALERGAPDNVTAVILKK